MADKHQKADNLSAIAAQQRGITPVTWAAARERLEKAER